MRLRVLCLNAWGLPQPVGRHVHERLSLILRDLPAFDCDLALFQEIWTDLAREQLIEGGRTLGYSSSWARPGDARGGGGLLALSRWPIRSSGFRPFTLCGLPQRFTQLDYYSGKGVARIDVEIDGVSIAVFNTHMHARYAPAKVVDDYRGHRTAEVVEFADEIRSFPGPLVAVGDFNMRDTAPEYHVLRGLTGLVDAADALDAAQPTSTLQNVYRRGRGAVNESRIDYVFCGAGRAVGVTPVSVRRIFDEPIEVAGAPGNHSDHAGLVADIEIGGAGRPLATLAPDARDLAQALLDQGRIQTRTRRLNERVGAGVSLLAGGAAIWGARRPELSRRAFLRTGLYTGAALAGASGTGLLTLTERHVPEELAGYDAADTILGSLR